MCYFGYRGEFMNYIFFLMFLISVSSLVAMEPRQSRSWEAIRKITQSSDPSYLHLLPRELHGEINKLLNWDSLKLKNAIPQIEALKIEPLRKIEMIGNLPDFLELSSFLYEPELVIEILNLIKKFHHDYSIYDVAFYLNNPLMDQWLKNEIAQKNNEAQLALNSILYDELIMRRIDYLDRIKRVLYLGASPNTSEYAGFDSVPAIILAVLGPEIDIELIKILLDAGADVTVPNNDGENALTIAALNPENIELINLLQKAQITQKKAKK